MNVKKIYANESDKGTLVCEKCGKTRTINLSEFKNIGKLLKVKCGCEHVFSAIPAYSLVTSSSHVNNMSC